MKWIALEAHLQVLTVDCVKQFRRVQHPEQIRRYQAGAIDISVHTNL